MVHYIVCIEAALVLEHSTVIDVARFCSARRHRAREYAPVPAVHEVAVQSVTGRVAVGEDEAATVVFGVECFWLEPDLIEDRNEMVWVCRWAAAIVDAVRVGHVGLVIWRVEVYAIPAGREKDLSPEAIRAVGVGESCSLRHRRTVEVDAGGIFRLIAIVKVWEKETDQSQEMALDSSVPGSLRAYGFPVNMRRPSGKASTVSP